MQPAHAVRPEVPAPVSAVLGQALSMHPGSRPASAVELRAALQATQQTAAVHPPPPPLAPTLVLPPQPPNTGSTVRMPAAPKLTPREREVLALVVGGYSDERIAQRLSMHLRMVRGQIDYLESKAGVQGR